MKKLAVVFAILLTCVTFAAQAMTPAPNSSSGSDVEKFTVNGVTFEMVRVDGGSFMMGDAMHRNERPVHSEIVSTFYIGRTEVTQALWTAVMGNNPSSHRGKKKPVDSVSWFDCQEFVDRLSRLTGRIFRLPTEAEWEFAARGGTRSRGYTYSGSYDIDRVAWNRLTCGSSATHPVAQKLDNELGLYDMSGNVLEWTSDCWSDDYNSPRKSFYRVYRGGSSSSSSNDCRVTYRDFSLPDRQIRGLGLRLALEVTP